MSNINLITFLDAAQRTIIGEGLSQDEKTVVIKNPVVVNILPQTDPTTGQPTGQMALQLLPVYFKEFQGDKASPTIFTYPVNQITQISFEGGFDFRLYAQYSNIFRTEAPQPAASKTETPVVKLFDE